jgi:hypothetical protein
VERVCARDIDCMPLKTDVWGEKVGFLQVFGGGKEKKIQKGFIICIFSKK